MQRRFNIPKDRHTHIVSRTMSTTTLFLSMNPSVKRNDVVDALVKKFVDVKKDEIKEILKSRVGVKSSRRNVTYDEFAEAIRVLEETVSLSKEEDEVVEKDVTMEKDLRLLSVEEVASFLVSNKLNAFV